MEIKKVSLKSLVDGFSSPWPDVISVPWDRGNGVPENPTYRYEMECIATLCKLQNPKKAFEFGTFEGFTTLVMAANTPEDALIYTLDLPLDWMPDLEPEWDRYNTSFAINRKRKNFFKGQLEERKINRIYEDSLKFDPAPYKGSIDFILVDANHQRKYLERDTNNAIKMCRPSGIILWHDYGSTWPDVTPFLNGLADSIDMVQIEGTNYAIHRRR